MDSRGNIKEAGTNMGDETSKTPITPNATPAVQRDLRLIEDVRESSHWRGAYINEEFKCG